LIYSDIASIYHKLFFLNVAMSIDNIHINPYDLISDIVEADYRTADVFRKYNIEYEATGQLDLSTICQNNRIDIDVLLDELNRSVMHIPFPHNVDCTLWPIDFLADFIIHMRHTYFKITLPDLSSFINKFTIHHRDDFPELLEITGWLEALSSIILQGIKQKEEVLFPYIRQIAHAHAGKVPYARLLALTLKKPLDELKKVEEKEIRNALEHIRQITSHYTTPKNAGITYTVAIAKLKELDDYLQHNMYLEYELLYPKAMAIEQELILSE